jgi:hypothetical protein
MQVAMNGIQVLLQDLCPRHHCHRLPQTRAEHLLQAQAVLPLVVCLLPGRARAHLTYHCWPESEELQASCVLYWQHEVAQGNGDGNRQLLLACYLAPLTSSDMAIRLLRSVSPPLLHGKMWSCWSSEGHAHL